MSGNQFLLWLDFETTGLDPQRSRPLEVAWTITDDRLRMLTPLHQRFIHIPVDHYGDHRTELATPLWTNDQTSGNDWLTGPEGWEHPTEMEPVVVDMHAASGLRDTWLRTYRTNPSLMIRRPDDLARLVTEDLADLDDGAGFSVRDGDRLALAGAGVSHFDNRLLAAQFSGLFTEFPSLPGWTYWFFDVSTALRVLGDAGWNRLQGVLTAAYADSETSVPYSVIECETAGTGDVGELIVADDRFQPIRLDVRNAREHRAADDVAVALVQARALRWLMEEV